MPDDLTLTIDGLLHFFGNKEQRHGSIGAKTSLLETVRLGVETLAHLNQKHNGEYTHPAAGLCEPLLVGDLAQTEQGLQRIAQTAPEAQFVEFCETLADYGATVSDPAKRKRSGILLYILGKARAEAQGGHQAIVSPFAQPTGQDSRYAAHGQRNGHVPALEAPAHPNEHFFRRYFAEDIATPAAIMQLCMDAERLDEAELRGLLKRFLDYAVTLRNDRKLRRAFGLNSALAGAIMERQQAERRALPPPQRH